jgi:hypothetical protein
MSTSRCRPYALGKKQYPYTDLSQLIQALYDAYGPQRLMCASDSPFQVQPRIRTRARSSWCETACIFCRRTIANGKTWLTSDVGQTIALCRLSCSRQRTLPYFRKGILNDGSGLCSRLHSLLNRSHDYVGALGRQRQWRSQSQDIA